jgi:shikimate kinase
MTMTAKRIALVGFRATGKSCVGQVLARQLQWTFVDMDEALTAAFGQSIDAWVQAHGWEAFRQAEARLLRQLARQSRLVVATGGGVVIGAANRGQLKEHFFVVWLQASAQSIHTRLRQDPKTAAQRPPLTGLPLQQEITTLLREREPWYREVADLSVAADCRDVATLVTVILAGMGGMQSG